MTTFGKGCHLHLIDGSAFIFRAYHALPPLTRKSDGLPVGAVSGFVNMLQRYVDGNSGHARIAQRNVKHPNLAPFAVHCRGHYAFNRFFLSLRFCRKRHCGCALDRFDQLNALLNSVIAVLRPNRFNISTIDEI